MKKFLVSILSIILVLSSFNLIACGNNPNKYLGHRHNGLYPGDFCEECEAVCWYSEEEYVVMELKIDYNQYFLLEVYTDNAFSMLEKNEILYSGKNDPFCNYRIKYVYIAPTVTTIPDAAFDMCKELEAIILSEGIEVIGGDAFYYCENLKKIDLPNSLERIDSDAFSSTPIKKIEFGSNLIEIGNAAFRGTNLKSISIPNSVEKIGAEAFAETNIKKATIGKNVAYIGEAAFNECNKNLKVKFKEKANWFVKNDHYEHRDIDKKTISNKKKAGHLLLIKYCNYEWLRAI